MSAFWSPLPGLLEDTFYINSLVVLLPRVFQRDPEKQMLSRFTTASYFPKHGGLAPLLVTVTDIGH